MRRATGTIVALAGAITVLGAAACSSSDNNDTKPADDVTPAPFENPSEGGLPQLNLGGGGTDPDAGADVSDDTNIAPIDPGPSTGRVIWGIDQFNHLARFGTTSLDKVAMFSLSGVLPGDRIVEIDFRPSTGVMYGLGRQNRVYMIDRKTGIATPVSPNPFMSDAIGQAQGFAFNAVTDRIRIHTDVDFDLRLDPTTGLVAAVDPTLAFADTDVNAGQSPNLVATAYTDSVTPAPVAVELYAIDSTRNILVKLPNPNDGKITTIGELGVDTTQVAGFDIWGNDATHEVYAALQVEGTTGTNLYTVDLATGAATLVGPIVFPLQKTTLSGIAVEP